MAFPIEVQGFALVAQQGAEGSGFMSLLPMLLMFAVIYFIILRPMSKQEKDRRKRVEGLKKGDQVVIGGGILGRISNLDDPKIAVVEIADKVKIRVLRKDLVDSQDAALKDADRGAKAAKSEKPAKSESSEPASKGA